MTQSNGSFTLNSATDLSSEPGALWNLTPEQKSRVADLLDKYLSGLENGLPPSCEALLRENPDLAEPLKAYFESLDELHGMAAGFQQHAGARQIECDLPLKDGPQANEQEGDEFADKEKRLGDFRILREIGRGGMGIVYEAEQISMGRRVALKVLPFAAVLDSRQIARFKHEAQAAGQLNHPNIVSVYAVGVERGVHFYAMQYIDGQPLDRAITELRERRKSTGPRPAASTITYVQKAQAASISTAPSTVRSVLTSRSPGGTDYIKAVIGLGVQAADAIDAAHQCGIVHRDIKPSNLLLDGFGKLWVTDFGLARRETDPTLTRTGDLIGTMRYMSPEQATGQNALVDNRTDIYSLGATLYELLTLEPVFAEHEGPSLLRQIELQEPRPLRKLQPRIPGDLQTVVQKAMAKRREDRYFTARAFADDLQRVFDGKPTVARPPTAIDRVVRWSTRHRQLVSVAAIICFLSLVGLGANMTMIAHEQQKRAEDFKVRFREAQDTVEHLGLQVYEKLGNVPGAIPVRRDLLRQTIGYYRKFVEQSKDNPALRADLARTYSKMGRLAAEIDSNAEAVAADRQAIDIFQQLVAAEPSDADSRRWLGVCQNNLGMVLARLGKSDEARQAYAQAIAMQESALKSATESGRSLAELDLAHAHSNLGLLQNATGDYTGAAVSFANSEKLFEQLFAGAPENPERMRDLAVAMNNLGSLYEKNQPDKAIEQYEKAAALQRRAAALHNDDPGCRGELALTYNNLGVAQSRIGATDAAVQSYASAVESERELVRMAPAQKSYRRTLAAGCNNLALAQYELKHYRDAEASFRQALAIQEELVARDPSDVDQQSLLGIIYSNLGLDLDDSKLPSEALKMYEKAIGYQRWAFTKSPDVNKYRQGLSKLYYNYARALRQSGQAAEAAKIVLLQRELWPHNPQHLFEVARELSLTSKALSSSSGAGLTSDECGKLAVETLKQAKVDGWKPPDHTDWTSSFAAIKNRPDFLALKD